MGKKSKNNVFDNARSTKEYFENILDMVPGHLYWKDENGVILGCNDAQAKSAGFKSRFEMVGKTDFDMPWKEQAEYLRKTDMEVMKSGTEKTVEEESVLSNGTKAVFLSKKSPIYCNGKIVGIVGISTDITDIKTTQNELSKEIEKSSRAYQSKTEFINIASHEIRRPTANCISLTSIVDETIDKLKSFFYGEIADNLAKDKKIEIMDKSKELFKQIKGYLSTISEQSSLALNYLINLGNLHTLESEKISVEFQVCDIHHLIDRILKKTPLIREKNIEVNTMIKENFDKKIDIDYQNVYEGLLIIFNNAARFSKENSVINVKIEPCDIDNNYFKIVIQDFGKGIEEKQLKQIFNTIFETDKNMENKYAKISLNLPQVKMKIEASGGKIDIESEINFGTKVKLLVYKRKVDLIVKNIEKSKKNNRKLNLLLVEDDKVMLEIEKKYVEKTGHNVYFETSAEAAINNLMNKEYDAVFLDVNLSGKNGIEVLRYIRRTKEGSIPVIMVTSHANSKDIDYFIEEGATEVLTKPVSLHVFEKCIDTLTKLKDD
jgi:PAS domain S-box-containing protein